MQPKPSEFSLGFDDSDDEGDETDEIERWVKSKSKNFDGFPTIKKIYLKFNTTLCSQASVERVFSFAKLLLGLRRGALGDENFEKQLVMKANKKLNPELFLKKDM